MTAGRNVGGPALRAALSAATDRLLAERTSAGHWVGELSDSALSTATAVFALGAADADANDGLIRRGLDWLVDNQNDDGGWGDSVRSRSNLSTTLLCWSAFAAAPRAAEPHDRAVAAAEAHIVSRAGGLAAEQLSSSVTGRYGEDRTFSAPILAMCALAGRLGRGPDAWKHVAQLPFELAACPHGALRMLRLNVVSYALPALIAIGQARHHHRPTRNPLLRAIRHLLAGRTLRVLAEIQPESGGFLEAAPLTSFVLMSLLSTGAAQGGSGVARRAVEFLRAGVRPSGAWPIDTDLATWVTTLSVNALPYAALDAEGREAIRTWLLDQQYAGEHAYTRAAPGGWAWTDRSGGVPDADDTAGALRALRRLGAADRRCREAAVAGCTWLLDLQNADGGVPTFCRGWGRLPFDRSCQDLAAHALLAWSAWRRDLPLPLQARTSAAIGKAVAFLRRRQGGEGQWTPLWFGNEASPDKANGVYGTARVLIALRELASRSGARGGLGESIRRAAEYLLSAAGEDGGWGGAAGVSPSIEETALAVEALSGLLVPPGVGAGALPVEAVRSAVRAGTAWLIEHTRGGTEFAPAPIGLYFAKLWYFERLYPIIFTVAALSRASEALGG